jgi:hypothetical protein
MLSAIREEVINTISCIVNEWNDVTNDQKVPAIHGVLALMAGIEDALAEVDQNDP